MIEHVHPATESRPLGGGCQGCDTEHLAARIAPDYLAGLIGDPILVVIAGSHSYGLAHDSSDIDIRGVFVAPTRSVLGLERPKDAYTGAEGADTTLHELGKFAHLALAGNPSALEVLANPMHLVCTEFGAMLQANRQAFYSERIVSSYAGYARGQMRTAQHHYLDQHALATPKIIKTIRHAFRVLEQGTVLRSTGEVALRPEWDLERWNPVNHDFDQIADDFNDALVDFDAVQSVLPDEPDLAVVNDLVVEARVALLNRGEA